MKKTKKKVVSINKTNTTVKKEISYSSWRLQPVPKKIAKNLNHFQCPYVLKYDTLFTLIGDYYNENPLVDEVKFHSKREMEEFIIQHHKTLFGEKTVIIDNTKNTNMYFPNVFLLDFNYKEKPRMYVVEINLSDDNLGLLFARITHFIASLSHKNYQDDFLAGLCNVINAVETKTEFKRWLYNQHELSELLSNMLDNKPEILLIKDNNNIILDLMQNVYVKTWGKMVRQILIKKYYCNNDTIFDISPLFAKISC